MNTSKDRTEVGETIRAQKRVGELERIIADLADRVHKTHHRQYIEGKRWRECPMMVCEIAREAIDV